MRNCIWHTACFREWYSNPRLFYMYSGWRHRAISHCLKHFGCANMLRVVLKQDGYSEICSKTHKWQCSLMTERQFLSQCFPRGTSIVCKISCWYNDFGGILLAHFCKPRVYSTLESVCNHWHRHFEIVLKRLWDKFWYVLVLFISFQLSLNFLLS